MFPAELSSWTSFSLLATPSPSHPTLSKDKICLVQDLTAAKRSFNCDQTALSQYHSKKQSTVAKNYKSLSILQHQTWSAILLKHRIELLPTPWSHQTLFTTVLFWFITYSHRCEYIQYAALLYRSANKYQPDLSPLGCKNLSEVEVRGCGASFNHRPITATEPRVV